MAQYEITDNATYRITKDGERELMANFVAQIAQETRHIDGNDQQTILTITGQQSTGPADSRRTVRLPEIQVAAEDFPGMSWVLPQWGVRAVIASGSSIKEDLRVQIQLSSAPKRVDIYKRTGWQQIGSKNFYLHRMGGVGEKGNNKSIRVNLPPDLQAYCFDGTDEFDKNEQDNTKKCVLATLGLIKLAPEHVTWTLLAGTLAPLFGPVDFAIHVAGRTGTFKSELLSLFQSHYGQGFDSRHLPGSWSSTPNALEAQTYYACNAAFTIDDFVPTGTAYQQRQYQVSADKIIRAQGNQAGRARLTDVSSLQKTMYPRGIILSTGEDIPEGHSVRARMMILELAPDDIKAPALTNAQAARKTFEGTCYAFIKHLSTKMPQQFDEYCAALRTKYVGIGHTRTPTMTARLVAVIEHFIEWCEEIGVLTGPQTSKVVKRAIDAIVVAAGLQQQYLENADPTEQFTNALRSVLATGGGHIRSMMGGVPLKPELFGWTEERSTSEMPVFKSRGPLIGWVDWNEDELYLDITGGYNILRKAAGNDLALSKQTLLKRLKEAGLLTRNDEARQRNTVRITIDGHVRQVISLSLSAMIDSNEKPSGEPGKMTQEPAKPAQTPVDHLPAAKP